MKKRYLILIGGILGWFACFALYAYGDQILASVKTEFLNAINNNAKTIVYKAQTSESKIAIMWAEKEDMPWKEAITVRVGNDETKKIRQIIFQKQ